MGASIAARALLATTALSLATPAVAQRRAAPARPGVQAQLTQALEQLRLQSAQIEAQAAQIAELRARLDANDRAVAAIPLPPARAAQGTSGASPGDPAAAQQVALERVGQAPEDIEQPIQLAVLDNAASVVTRRNQITAEFQLDYARADRNRAIFRGIELVEAVLVGVFDINENRQDVLTASASVRGGVTDRLEVGMRLPYIYRADTSIIAPIANSTPNDPAATIDNSVKGRGIGDFELSARYQLLDGGRGRPYVIANLQGVIPTGSDPFAIPRDSVGRAVRAATGAGFYGISAGATAILPTDPVVLFGTLGYTWNIAKAVDTRIPPIIITHVDPGDAISASAGIGIAFNQRTTLNLGYAHSWAFGTRTRTRLIEPTAAWPGERETRSRDLQVGRLLFGVTYRATDRASINWAVEVGATEDATDMRTTLRVPLVLLTGG